MDDPYFDAPATSDELVTVATYDDAVSARLALAHLRAAGLSATIADEQTVAMDWLLSNAIGGIKVQVNPKDVSTARQLIEEHEWQKAAIDDVPTPIAEDMEKESMAYGRPAGSPEEAVIIDDELVRIVPARGQFDEIVVVDTGSKDRTPEIAAEFGARVFDFARADDFAAARNAALARTTGGYAFWLDADDVIDPPRREKLEALLASLGGPRLREGERPCEPHSDAPGCGVSPARTEPRPPGLSLARTEPRHPNASYVVKRASDRGPNEAGGNTHVDHIRLFPIREDARWTYRVHEQILPALKRANVPVRWSDVTVRPAGDTDRASRLRTAAAVNDDHSSPDRAAPFERRAWFLVAVRRSAL
jgi:hypothetical protein